MVRQNTVTQFGGKNRWKSRYFLNLLSDLFRSHKDVSQKLTIVSVIVHREIRNLIYLCKVVENRCGQQKITIQYRIIRRHKITQSGYCQCVLQQSAHEAVMHCFRCGMYLELLDKCGVLDECILGKLF